MNRELLRRARYTETPFYYVKKLLVTFSVKCKMVKCGKTRQKKWRFVQNLKKILATAAHQKCAHRGAVS